MVEDVGCKKINSTIILQKVESNLGEFLCWEVFLLGSKLNFKLVGEDDVSIIKCLVVQL